MNTCEGTHDVHALILGRTQTSLQAFLRPSIRKAAAARATRCAQLCRRLIADLNPSHSPAVACHDALRNEVAIAARFRVVAAEAGRVAAPAPETTYAPGG
jgi:hypothetical protein